MTEGVADGATDVAAEVSEAVGADAVALAPLEALALVAAWLPVADVLVPELGAVGCEDAEPVGWDDPLAVVPVFVAPVLVAVVPVPVEPVFVAVFVLVGGVPEDVVPPVGGPVEGFGLAFVEEVAVKDSAGASEAETEETGAETDTSVPEDKVAETEESKDVGEETEEND